MKIGLALLLLFPAALFSQDINFNTGVHLINEDDTTYTVVYREYTLTTRICQCIKPTPTMKNGLVPASMREAIPGWSILSTKAQGRWSEITATIAPHTTVSCLGVNLGSLTVEGVGNTAGLYDQLVVIKNGKLVKKPLG